MLLNRFMKRENNNNTVIKMLLLNLKKMNFEEIYTVQQYILAPNPKNKRRNFLNCTVLNYLQTLLFV